MGIGAASAIGWANHCLGRSRGGLTTKVHAVVDRQGLPIRLGLSVRQAHDVPAALTLLDRSDSFTIALGDKAYDGNANRELYGDSGALSVANDDN